MEAAIDYIQEHICHKLTVSALAHMPGIDRSYFSSIFKRQIGCSPKQYIQTQKLEKAKILLETTEMSVQAISHLLGYSNQFAFSHAFQQNTGESPRDWRKLHDTSLGSALR
nr:AraC family transcriptional regulator [uncultured Acetatifactor sp.]